MTNQTAADIVDLKARAIASNDGGLRGRALWAATEIEALRAREAELKAEIDTPLTDDFTRAVNMEALHQRERWGSDHDAGKTPLDWFWLIGYLAQKAADAAIRGDSDKAKHHTISTAAALANWHLAISGIDTRMRSGIDTPGDALATIRGETD